MAAGFRCIGGIACAARFNMDPEMTHRTPLFVFEELGMSIDAGELASLGESIYANKRKRVYCDGWERSAS